MKFTGKNIFDPMMFPTQYATSWDAPKKDFLVRPAVLSGMIDQNMKVVMAKTDMKVNAAHFCHSVITMSACSTASPGMLLTAAIGQTDVKEDDHGNDIPDDCSWESSSREVGNEDRSRENEDETNSVRW
jgi:hypothetical protein